MALRPTSPRPALLHRRLRETTDQAALEQASRSPDEADRIDVALNVHTPPAVLSELACDGSAHVRREVARHVNIPQDASLALASDDDLITAGMLAHNRSLSPEVYTVLAAHPEPAVITALASNPSTPGDIVRQLADRWAARTDDRPDSDDVVVWRARREVHWYRLARELATRPELSDDQAALLPTQLVCSEAPDRIYPPGCDPDLAEVVASLAPDHPGSLAELWDLSRHLLAHPQAVT
jgi:hypothetical protein